MYRAHQKIVVAAMSHIVMDRCSGVRESYVLSCRCEHHCCHVIDYAIVDDRNGAITYDCNNEVK